MFQNQSNTDKGVYAESKISRQVRTPPNSDFIINTKKRENNIQKTINFSKIQDNETLGIKPTYAKYVEGRMCPKVSNGSSNYEDVSNLVK